MQASELPAAAIRVLTGGTSASAEQTAAVRELVWGRLGRSALGSSALARLHEQPGEGSAGIVSSVIADEVQADPKFAERLRTALEPLSTPATHAPASNIAAGPPPPVTPPMPAVTPPPAAPDGAEVRKVWLLGLPQFLVGYVILSVLGGGGLAGSLVFLLISGGLAVYGVRCGIRLLRHTRSPLLIAGTVLTGLVLIRLVLYLLVG
ncbi:hypothetical protein ACLQ2N_21960 [Streptomyces sp. DT224]|uniref:hypothetical protein n=1 Tax=Streptomyces sp. DT224 TaxID=3393426 RepID=UPI003CEB211B